MIAKINLDGKEHMAIVFNEYVDFENIQEIKDSLNYCMQIALQGDKECSQELYHLSSLVEEMALSINQINEMFFFYFGKKQWNRVANKSQKKSCEIYL